MESLSLRVFRRAHKDTWAHFRVDLQTVATALLLMGSGAGIDFMRRGFVKMFEEVDVFISWTLAPLGGFIILLFLWNLFLAPFRIVEEKLDVALKPKSPAHVAVPEAIEFEEPDYAAWRKREKATIGEIARVCAGLEPYTPVAIGIEEVFVGHILEGAARGKIRCLEMPAGKPDRRVTVYLREVRTYFEELKIQTPLFDGSED